jgi:hypothetical protein
MRDAGDRGCIALPADLNASRRDAPHCWRRVRWDFILCVERCYDPKVECDLSLLAVRSSESKQASRRVASHCKGHTALDKSD